MAHVTGYCMKNKRWFLFASQKNHTRFRTCSASARKNFTHGATATGASIRMSVMFSATYVTSCIVVVMRNATEINITCRLRLFHFQEAVNSGSSQKFRGNNLVKSSSAIISIRQLISRVSYTGPQVEVIVCSHGQTNTRMSASQAV